MKDLSQFVTFSHIETSNTNWTHCVNFWITFISHLIIDTWIELKINGIIVDSSLRGQYIKRGENESIW